MKLSGILCSINKLSIGEITHKTLDKQWKIKDLKKRDLWKIKDPPVNMVIKYKIQNKKWVNHTYEILQKADPSNM